MARNDTNRPSGRKRRWFARRQVYLRTGQESQYVELSPMLQIGVALGFCALVFGLIGASYSAVTGAFGEGERTALLARLDSSERALGDLEQERDATQDGAARIAELETALTDAKARADEASKQDETLALTSELDQTRLQLEELHQRLAQSNADQAALQARLEAAALTTADTDEKTAEEASSLHSQLEDAFDEIETLKEETNAATAKVVALNEEKAAKEEAIDRNTALLKAATAEIERLQNTVKRANAESVQSLEGYQAKIASLEEQLGEVVGERDGLEREVDQLANRLEETETAALQAVEPRNGPIIDVTADAQYHAQSIADGLKEADLLTTIEGLRTELAAAGTTEGGNQADDGDEIRSLRERAVIAESEIERLILAGLNEDIEPAAPPASIIEEDPAETERLRTELLAAEADIIKLNADVKAAKSRLAEQAETPNGQASRPDNSAKLEQQLASSRSRVQQLNKALADAKLREVAIDLALINVVPIPSPPAPR